MISCPLERRGGITKMAVSRVGKDKQNESSFVAWTTQNDLFYIMELLLSLCPNCMSTKLLQLFLSSAIILKLGSKFTICHGQRSCHMFAGLREPLGSKPFFSPQKSFFENSNLELSCQWLQHHFAVRLFRYLSLHWVKKNNSTLVFHLFLFLPF